VSECNRTGKARRAPRLIIFFILKKLFTLFVCTALLAGCGAAENVAPAVPVVTTVAAEASLPEQLLLTGVLEPDSSIQISAKAGGRIGSLTHETGDRVARGDVLARLDAATESAVSSSLQKNLAEAEKQLVTIRALYDERISSAEASFDSVRTSGQAQVALVETRLRTATQDTERTKASALTTAAILLEQTADMLDMLVGVTDKNRTANDVFEQYLGALDSATRPAATDAVREFLRVEAIFRTAFDEQILSSEPSEDELRAVLLLTKDAFAEAKVALEAAHSLLLKSTTSPAYTAVDLAAHKTSVLTLGGAVESQLAVVQDLLGASSIAVLAGELTQTRAAVAAQIQTAELALENVKKEKAVKLSEVEAQITRFRGELAVSGTTLADTTITAPISGVITEQYGEVGQVVAAGTPIFELANDATLQIIVEAPDTVAPALLVGDTAEVTLDNLSGQTFLAMISKVSPAADPITKKRAVELSLANDEGLSLGLFARVHFSLPEIDGIVIPASALISRYGQHFVFIVEDSHAVQRQVTLGTRTSQLIAIESGLAVGEVVIIKGNSWLRNGDAVELQGIELAE